MECVDSGKEGRLHSVLWKRDHGSLMVKRQAMLRVLGRELQTPTLVNLSRNDLLPSYM